MLPIAGGDVRGAWKDSRGTFEYKSKQPVRRCY
jgi:hypothetical protein